MKRKIKLPFFTDFLGAWPNWPLTSCKRFSSSCFFSLICSSFVFPGVLFLAAVTLREKKNYNSNIKYNQLTIKELFECSNFTLDQCKKRSCSMACEVPNYQALSLYFILLKNKESKTSFRNLKKNRISFNLILYEKIILQKVRITQNTLYHQTT